MRYLILGPLEVRDGDTGVELRGGQQRKLLAILLLHSGEAVSSDLLVEELWDGKPPETAAKALQGYVSSLRKQLGQEAVETVGGGYRLTVAPEDLDSGRFEELLAEARPLERAPAVAKLREALALWRGPALADYAYDDFARHEIDRLEELRLGGVERRIDLELALGHHDDLVPELEALVRAHPLRERLRGHLMVALYRCGRQAEALDAYQEARTALRDELGLEPSEELQALQRAILDHDASLAAPPRVDLPAAAGESRLPEGRKLRRPLLAVALGLAIIGGAAATIVLTRTDKAAAIIVPPNSVARIDPAGTKVESYVGVGTGPRAIAVGLGSVWVANGEDGTVDRLDPGTGSFQEQSHPIGIGGGDLSDIAIGSHAVWVADGNAGTVTRIDPNLDQVAATIPHDPKQTVAPNPVFYVAYGSHYVWATRANELLRIDPHTNQIDKRLVIGTPTGLATGGGSVWVTTQSGLRRIDPVKVKEISHRLFGYARAPVYTRGSVWLIADNEIQQIDPITLARGDAEPAGSQPASLAAGGGALWAADFFDGRLTRLAADGGRTTSLRVGKNLGAVKNGPPGASNLSAVAVGGGATWVAVSVGH
jgi:DNA-binding SARP family transcriptional activator/streptogramin lyase